MDSHAFVAAGCVACYQGQAGEVGTERIAARCRETGKRVCLPAWRDEDGGYAFCAWEEGEDLRPARWGIPQPACPRWLGAGDRIDLVLVPGVAFDRRGGRVGHGKGYYDALLRHPCAQQARRVGLAFDFQVVEQVPMEDHDVPMDAVAAEMGLLDMTIRGGS